MRRTGTRTGPWGPQTERGAGVSEKPPKLIENLLPVKEDLKHWRAAALRPTQLSSLEIRIP